MKLIEKLSGNPKMKNKILFKLIGAKCEKKSCFLNTSAEANLLFPDVCHPVNGQGGLHALSNISRKKEKKKKRDSLTDSHLMDTSRCCHRTRFSAQ